MYVLVAYIDEENQMKNEGARVVTTLYSYILDAQGKLTLQLVVGCGRKSNSFKLLWVSMLPVRMRIIHSKMMVLEWSQHYQSILRCSRAANSIIVVGTLMKFKLIQAFIAVLLICKNEYDLLKNESARVVTTFLPL